MKPIERIKSRRGKRGHPVFAIVGCIGEHNAGDEALFASVVSVIRGRWPEARIVAFSNDIRHTVANYNVEAVPAVGLVSPSTMIGALIGGATRAAFNTLLRSDCLVVCGGELIRTDFGLKATLTVFDRIILAKLLGRPVVALGVGVGKLSGWFHKAILAFGLRQAHVLVRDPGSQDNFEALGVGSATLTCDLALFLNPVDPRVAPPRGDWFAVCIRDPRGTRSSFFTMEEAVAFKSSVADALTRIYREHGMKPVFVPFGFYPDDDLPYLLEIAERMAPDVEFDVVKCEMPPAELLGFLSEARFVVGMRLHSCVFGVRLDLPTIGLAYDDKVRKFMTYCGRGEVCLSLREVANLDGAVRRVLSPVGSTVRLGGLSGGLDEFQSHVVEALEEAVSD